MGQYSQYLGTLEDLLVLAVQLERLLEVQVGGGQGDGEVDPTHVGEDSVLGQRLQSHTRVLACAEIVDKTRSVNEGSRKITTRQMVSLSTLKSPNRFIAMMSRCAMSLMVVIGF